MSDVRIAARYRLEDELARTAGTAMWAASDLWLDRPVVVEQPIGTGDTILKGFVERTEVLARLGSRSVAPVLDVGTHAGRPFAVFDRPPRTLADRLATGALAPGAAAAIAATVVEGLADLHAAGLVHGAVGADAVAVGDRGDALVLPFVGDRPAAGAGSTRGDVVALGDLVAGLPGSQVATGWLAEVVAAAASADDAVELRSGLVSGASVGPVVAIAVATTGPASRAPRELSRTGWRAAAVGAVAVAVLLGARATGFAALVDSSQAETEVVQVSRSSSRADGPTPPGRVPDRTTVAPPPAEPPSGSGSDLPATAPVESPDDDGPEVQRSVEVARAPDEDEPGEQRSAPTSVPATPRPRPAERAPTAPQSTPAPTTVAPAPAPSTTAPAPTTAPATTAPATTAPPTTAPATTVPPTTAPSTTAPSTTAAPRPTTTTTAAPTTTTPTPTTAAPRPTTTTPTTAAPRPTTTTTADRGPLTTTTVASDDRRGDDDEQGRR